MPRGHDSAPESQRRIGDAPFKTRLIDAFPDGVVNSDGGRRIVSANRAFAAYVGLILSELPGRQASEVEAAFLDAEMVHDLTRAQDAGEPWRHEVDARGPDGTPIRLDVRFAPTRDEGGEIGWTGTLRDVTAQRREQRDLRRLVTPIEQMPDAVVMTDAAGTIEYVNAAFERITGYSRDEVLGLNPRILKSGVHDPAFYAAMWAIISSGTTFVGDITNRRKDGSLFQTEAAISPIRGADGVISGYVAVNHDVTRERAAEDGRARDARERSQIATALASLPIVESVTAAANAICQQVVRISGVEAATLMYFSVQGPATTLALVRADATPVPLRRIPLRRSQTLQELANQGPWVESWIHRPWHPYERAYATMGVTALAGAPLRHNNRLIGVLEIMSADAGAEHRLTEILPTLLEFAGISGALLGPSITDLTEVGLAQVEIEQVISETAFGPVFQPIVDLDSNVHVGYEALSRFATGVRPDLVFAKARSAGLETELELATTVAAVSAAASLPQGAWLSLNVSPTLLMAPGPLASVLAGAERPLVLEVTEHVEIADYLAVRDAIGSVAPGALVAVDDAGSGVANFAHILQLNPDYVKTDLVIVRGIETDLMRRALVLGLLAFARESTSQVIAEGIETEEELAILRKLGVPFGQGHLLGQPAPAAEWAAMADVEWNATTTGRKTRGRSRSRRARPGGG